MLSILISPSGGVEGVLEPGTSSTTARNMAILRHIPFVVPFKDRVKVRCASVFKESYRVKIFSWSKLIDGTSRHLMVKRLGLIGQKS